MARQLVCLGFGQVAAAVARALGQEDWRIVGTNRDGRPVAGAEIAPFAGAPAERLRFILARADAILVSIPPDDDGDLGFRAFGEEVRPGAWVGYLSTTGVYGDRQGGWAFEDDPPTPQSVQAKRRALAEAQWQSAAGYTHIFRLPGLYGPGRSALDRLRAGDARRIVKPGLVHSRVHVDDVAGAIVASLAAPAPQRVYNVCDDEPSPPETVIEEAARLASVSPPPLIPYDQAILSPEARRFYEESRRVSNARLKAELGWRPRFPSFREGLAAIAALERPYAA